jgi:hypoxanthine phosphoribosyltransferase
MRPRRQASGSGIAMPEIHQHGGRLAVRVLHDEAAIAGRIAALAREIAGTLSGEPTVVGLLKGGFVFTADLVRALGREGLSPRVEFMQVASYGAAKESSGHVRLIGDVPNVSGQDVLLLDDIQDTGRSLAYAKSLLEEAGAVRVWTAVLADKPSRRRVDFAADFIGFVVDDVFLVGYGIDYAERYRYLPYIGTVD